MKHPTWLHAHTNYKLHSETQARLHVTVRLNNCCCTNMSCYWFTVWLHNQIFEFILQISQSIFIRVAWGNMFCLLGLLCLISSNKNEFVFGVEGPACLSRYKHRLRHTQAELHPEQQQEHLHLTLQLWLILTWWEVWLTQNGVAERFRNYSQL